MAQDPRKFLVKNCGKAIQKYTANQSARKSFFGNQGPIGQIGDLEILNETKTGGKIGEGLRALASTSELIRTGQKSPSILSNLAQGENEVLDSVGINPGAVEQASRLNPAVANRALGQARSIYQQVQQGNFDINDIPEAVADFKNLEKLISGIFTELPSENTKLYEQCGASPYAIDLIAFAPKFKYLFIVQFEYTDPYKDMSDLDHAFVVKTSTRPNIQFDYEDINMYNYHTKVAKMVRYEPMTMTFLDDNLNHAGKFYNTYLRAMSPIANMRFDQKTEDQGIYEETGMEFNNLNQGYTGLKNGNVISHSYSASLGPLIGEETKNILKRITLFHVYSYGRLMNVYRFFNPKITSMEFDQLNMEESGPSELTFDFAYDAVNILNDYEINPAAIRGETPSYNLEQLSGRNRALYPIKWYSGPNEVQVSPDVGPTAQNENDEQNTSTNGFGEFIP